MKKYYVIAIIVILISVLFYINIVGKFIPLIPPNINVTYNGNKIETAKGEYTWVDKPDGGATYFGDTPSNLTKKLKSIPIKKGGQIKFTFNTLWKQPSKTTVCLVISNTELNEQVTNINSFNVPKEKGEYTFLISSFWDEGHEVSYVFKIDVI